MTLKSKILNWAGMSVRCKGLILNADKSNTTNDLDMTFSAVVAAGGDSATAGSTHVLPVVINGTTYYVQLNTDNA